MEHMCCVGEQGRRANTTNESILPVFAHAEGRGRKRGKPSPQHHVPFLRGLSFTPMIWLAGRLGDRHFACLHASHRQHLGSLLRHSSLMSHCSVCSGKWEMLKRELPDMPGSCYNIC